MRKSAAALLIPLTTAALVVAASPTTAQPDSVAAASGTGSSAADSATSAAQSAIEFARQGDLIGFIVLLGVAPIRMFTGGMCDLITWSGSSNPCSPTRYPAAAR